MCCNKLRKHTVRCDGTTLSLTWMSLLAVNRETSIPIHRFPRRVKVHYHDSKYNRLDFCLKSPTREGFNNLSYIRFVVWARKGTSQINLKQSCIRLLGASPDFWCTGRKFVMTYAKTPNKWSFTILSCSYFWEPCNFNASYQFYYQGYDVFVTFWKFCFLNNVLPSLHFRISGSLISL